VKILIIKPSSLGDVIHALPFLKAVKDAFPESIIDWLISKSLKGILEDNPLINDLIIIDKDSWKYPGNIGKTSRELINLRKTLRRRHYDMVIDLQGLLRSGIISMFAPSSLRIGFTDAREGSRYLYHRKVSVNGIAHAVDKNLEVARVIQKSQKSRVKSQKPEKIEFPLYIDKTAGERVKRLLGNINEKGYIVIVPSARWATKRWPEERFAGLISRIPIPCIIAGSRSDRPVAQRVYNLSQKKPVDLCGKTDLKELVALICNAGMLISGDTGPMHIAVALDVPVIALFGPTDPERTGPYGWRKKDNIRVIRSGAPCSPCKKRRCMDPFCMTDISVDMVLQEVKSLL